MFSNQNPAAADVVSTGGGASRASKPALRRLVDHRL